MMSYALWNSSSSSSSSSSSISSLSSSSSSSPPYYSSSSSSRCWHRRGERCTRCSVQGRGVTDRSTSMSTSNELRTGPLPCLLPTSYGQVHFHVYFQRVTDRSTSMSTSNELRTGPLPCLLPTSYGQVHFHVYFQRVTDRSTSMSTSNELRTGPLPCLLPTSFDRPLDRLSPVFSCGRKNMGSSNNCIFLCVTGRQLVCGEHDIYWKRIIQ